MPPAIEEVQTLSSSTSRPKPATSPEPILIRPARLFEGHHVGRIAARTYNDQPLSKALAPRRAEFYGDYERGYKNRGQARLFSPRTVTLFAYEKSRPESPIGYVCFVRMGDDEAARKMDRDVGVTWRFLYFVLSWMWWAWVKVADFWHGPDRASDPVAVGSFSIAVMEDEKTYWEGRPERANRWHAQSVVILPEYQGMGIGKRLMAEIIGRAESEGVIMGLEASAVGEGMYRNVGFELLGRFAPTNTIEGSGGGIMMRKPTSWKKVESGR